MRAIRDLVILSLGITLSACAAAEALPSCPNGLPPVTTAPPKLPPRLHNGFTGKAEVSFVISPSGHVQSPAIVSAEWHPVGRSTGQPIAYSEAILSAVANWRYSHRPQACRHRISVEFQAEGSSPGCLLNKQLGARHLRRDERDHQLVRVVRLDISLGPSLGLGVNYPALPAPALPLSSHSRAYALTRNCRFTSSGADYPSSGSRSQFPPG